MYMNNSRDRLPRSSTNRPEDEPDHQAAVVGIHEGDASASDLLIAWAPVGLLCVRASRSRSCGVICRDE